MSLTLHISASKLWCPISIAVTEVVWEGEETKKNGDSTTNVNKGGDEPAPDNGNRYFISSLGSAWNYSEFLI